MDLASEMGLPCAASHRRRSETGLRRRGRDLCALYVLLGLSFQRFSLAKLVGTAPASFPLAHCGKEMRTGDTDRVLI